MQDDRPILILTASTGAGHNVAASAVEAALRAAHPTEPVEVHDVLESAGALFRWAYGGGYVQLVRHLPMGMGWLYDVTDRPDRPIGNGVRRFVQNACTRGTVRYILRRRPKLVINTHYMPAEIVAGLRRRGRLDCPQVTVTTDFETHRIWVHEPTEQYYTATAQGRAYLARWGAPPERILVTGIPVRAGFETRIERHAARECVGLSPDGPVVLLLGGNVGYGATDALLDELIRMPTDAQIAVVTGRNECLRRRCETRARTASRRVVVSGYTDRLHEWMYAADLVVTKPGGLTTSEALACGLPMLLVNPIPGQETRNADYLLEHGAAVKVNHPRALSFRIAEILGNPDRLQALRTAARSLARPGAAACIVQNAMELLEAPDVPSACRPAQGTAPGLLASPPYNPL